MIKCYTRMAVVVAAIAGVSPVSARAQSGPEIAPSAVSRSPAGATIGTVEMDRDGTIRLHLTAVPQSAPDNTIRPGVAWARPEERIAYGEIELQPQDPNYKDVLSHVGGPLAGQTKPVPPWRPHEKWHCALDPDRGPCPLEHLLPSPASAASWLDSICRAPVHAAAPLTAGSTRL